MILQRYTFGSKSQHSINILKNLRSCLWYCKDIHLEANHNDNGSRRFVGEAAYDIAKIYIWKQITTCKVFYSRFYLLLMILQRYTFGSKSQRFSDIQKLTWGCLWYCKDIHLEANHNPIHWTESDGLAAYDIAKIYIWKQITTSERMLF